MPDISRPETKLLFYYLAASYIELGIEGIHFEQVELMNKNDQQLDHYAQVLALIRSYAAKHARRKMIICDSHVPGGGFVKDGKLLMDVHAFPLRIMETPEKPEKPEEAILKVGYTDALYGRSKGGITPSGWSCESLPYLVELDNYGASWLKPTPMATWKCPAAGKQHASPTIAGMMPTIDQRPYPMVMATQIPSAIYGPKEEQRINDHPQKTGYEHSRGIGKQCPDHQKIRLQNKYYP